MLNPLPTRTAIVRAVTAAVPAVTATKVPPARVTPTATVGTATPQPQPPTPSPGRGPLGVPCTVGAAVLVVAGVVEAVGPRVIRRRAR